MIKKIEFEMDTEMSNDEIYTIINLLKGDLK